MPRDSADASAAREIARQARRAVRRLLVLVPVLILASVETGRATLLWCDLGTTQVHDNLAGNDILGGALKRDDASSDTLYFKFHVDPLSDASTEIYSAAFQMFEGNMERLAVGNAPSAFAYSAFSLGQSGQPSAGAEYIDLKSANPEPSGIGTFHTYELVHSAIERTIVFKVQYVAGGEDMVTVWLDPDLRLGATESNQLENLTTKFKANAAFDQIRLRHTGGGDGWVFSEMGIATTFGDFVNANGAGTGGETPFAFRAWQREQGLPENYVRAVAQTRDGYVWVGGDDGVSRFDGVSFFPLGLPEGFQVGPVQSLFGDSKGALWIGSVGGGLSRWQSGKLARFTVNDGWPSESITAMAEDKSGRMWVGTQNGLAIWNNGHLDLIKGTELFRGKTVTTLFCDGKGVIWVGVTGLGVFSYNNGKFDRLRDKDLDELLQAPHCILVDAQGRIWIGAGEAFVLCKDGKEWLRFGIPQHLVTHHISALAEQPDGTVWAGSAGEGLLEFKAGKLVVVNASSGLSDNIVESLLVDREGKLWVGTHGGLNRVSLKRVLALSHNAGLDYGAVQSLAEVQPGMMWASQPNGVYQWDGRIFRRLALTGLSAQAGTAAVLLAGRQNDCWVAGAKGLTHFINPKMAEEEATTILCTNLSIRALGHDSQNGLWAGTRDGELWHLAGGKLRLQTNFSSGYAITAMVQDREGKLWVGTEGDGLYQLDGDGFRHNQKVTGLPSSWIRTLYVDAENTLWIGTAGGGLCRWHQAQLTTFTMREGLPDNTVSQILDDDAGNLWLGDNRGITRIKKRELEGVVAQKVAAVYPQVYGRAEGMLSEECAGVFSPSGLKSQSGLLWFSTLKGVVVIDPHQLMTSPAPVVILEKTVVDGVGTASRKVPVEHGSLGKERKGNDAETIELPPGNHIVEFHYTGLNFDAPDRVRFRYRLEGLDQDWVEAGNRQVAFYNSVPAGSYRFQVIACNGDEIWNETGTTLGLMVSRHFFQTWWFILLAGLGIISAIIAGVRVLEKRKLDEQLKRLDQERLLERERTRIAQDLHDIMGAKLCRISFLSEHARRTEGISPDLQEEIGSISDDSREVLQSLDEMVWAVNPEKDTLEHLVSYIGQYAQDYFRTTGIECQLVFPPRIPRQPLSSQSRHHLFLGVHEALTNILKHSHATRATIVMTCPANRFEVAISDNGSGFDPISIDSNSSSSAAGFCNGLGNMRRRLADLGGSCQIESKAGQGTTIRFVFEFDNPLK